MRCGHHDSHASDQSFKYGRSQSNIVNYHPRTNCNINHTQSCCPAENCTPVPIITNTLLVVHHIFMSDSYPRRLNRLRLNLPRRLNRLQSNLLGLPPSAIESATVESRRVVPLWVVPAKIESARVVTLSDSIS